MLLVVLGTSVLRQAAGLPLALGAFLVRFVTPCMCIFFGTYVAAGGVGGTSVLPHADSLLLEALLVRHTNNLDLSSPCDRTELMQTFLKHDTSVHTMQAGLLLAETKYVKQVEWDAASSPYRACSLSTF